MTDELNDDAPTYRDDDEFETDVEAENDESTAVTQDAFDRERAEIEEASSEDVALIGHDRDAIEAYGFKPAWWGEENGLPVLDIAVDVANQICGYVGHVKDLERHGWSSDALPGELTLGSLSGPVVFAALQILGTVHPHLREEIVPLLVAVKAAMPEPTEAETEAYNAAEDALAAEFLEEQREAFKSMGLGDLFEQGASPHPDIDASNN